MFIAQQTPDALVFKQDKRSEAPCSVGYVMHLIYAVQKEKT